MEVIKEMRESPTRSSVKNEELIDDITKNLTFKKSASNQWKFRGAPTPCPICGVIISNPYNLSCHLRRHNNNRPYKCQYCPASFILRTELRRHDLTHSKDRPFKCTLCTKDFKTAVALKLHMDSHGINVYSCKHCDTKFRDQRQCSSHEKNFHAKNKMKCRYCYKTFSDTKYRERHESLVHHKKINTKSTGSNISDLKTNKVCKRKGEGDRTDSKYFPCRVCKDRFTFRKDQLAHYQNCHKEEFYKAFKVCKICAKILTEKHYSEHMNAHQGNLPFECANCDYKSARKVDLKNHMLIHNKEVFYNCKVCQKIFKTKEYSLRCEKRHSGKKDVKCKQCDKTFFSIRELGSHLASKHKTRKCLLCNYETTDYFGLVYHNKTHHKLYEKRTQNKNVMCDKCGDLFLTHKALSIHSKSHIKLYQDSKEQICSYCDYKSLSTNDILFHCIKFHPSKVNRCDICSYNTLRYQSYLTHMRNHIDKSADELYIIAKIDKKLEEECKAFAVECFLCGYSSEDNELIINHFKNHEQAFKDLSWFSCHNGFNIKTIDTNIKEKKKCKTTQNAKTNNSSESNEAIDSEEMTASETEEVQSNTAKLSEDKSQILSLQDIGEDNNFEFQIEIIDPYNKTSEYEPNDSVNGLNVTDTVFSPLYKASEDINVNPNINSTISTKPLCDQTGSSKGDYNPIIQISGLSNNIQSQDVKTTGILSSPSASGKVTIKIKELESKEDRPIKLIADSMIEDTSEADDINSLKTKLKTIDGKLFLPLEDLCSLKNLNTDILLQFLKRND